MWTAGRCRPAQSLCYAASLRRIANYLSDPTCLHPPGPIVIAWCGCGAQIVWKCQRWRWSFVPHRPNFFCFGSAISFSDGRTDNFEFDHAAPFGCHHYTAACLPVAPGFPWSAAYNDACYRLAKTSSMVPWPSSWFRRWSYRKWWFSWRRPAAKFISM